MAVVNSAQVGLAVFPRDGWDGQTGCYKIWEIGLLIISTGWIQT